jgi:hypothetical protein
MIGPLIDEQMPIVSLPGVVEHRAKDTGVTIQRLINPHLNGHTRLCCNHWL